MRFCYSCWIRLRQTAVSLERDQNQQNHPSPHQALHALMLAPRVNEKSRRLEPRREMLFSCYLLAIFPEHPLLSKLSFQYHERITLRFQPSFTKQGKRRLDWGCACFLSLAPNTIPSIKQYKFEKNNKTKRTQNLNPGKFWLSQPRYKASAKSDQQETEKNGFFEDEVCTWWLLPRNT